MFIMTTELSTYIGERLKPLRHKLRLTQLELAEKADIDSNTYAKIERGDQTPSLETLEKIVKALGVKSSDVLPF
jgi:transcriptional regulator with XRE-family HTH domain